MLEVLKDFDSNIVSINATTPTSVTGINFAYGRVYYSILSKDKNRALPLNMYGDGMKKAILLMSAVVAAKCKFYYILGVGKFRPLTGECKWRL